MQTRRTILHQVNIHKLKLYEIYVWVAFILVIFEIELTIPQVFLLWSKPPDFFSDFQNDINPSFCIIWRIYT